MRNQIDEDNLFKYEYMFVYEAAVVERQCNSIGKSSDRTGHIDSALATDESAACAGAILSESTYRVASSRAQITAAAVSPLGGQAWVCSPDGHDSG